MPTLRHALTSTPERFQKVPMHADINPLFVTPNNQLQLRKSHMCFTSEARPQTP